MSSVIKKKSAFTPKAAKRALRRPLETPPATQEALAEPQEKEPSILTPPSTQAEAKAAEENKTDEAGNQDQKELQKGKDLDERNKDKKDQDPLSLRGYSIANVLPKAAVEALFDPMLKVPNSAVVSDEEDDTHANEDDYGDNDIFKHPMAPEARRRSSVANLRRLSGISAFRRPSSFSATPDPGDEGSVQVPVTIGIPVAKPARKRRSSMSSRSRKLARSSIIGIPQSSGAVPEELEEAPLSNQAQKNVEDSREIVVGVDPATQKLRKFRTSASVAGHDDLPVAPEDLVTTITSVKQLPKQIAREDEHLFASVAVETAEFSMSDLCKPSFKIGEVSEKFQMAEDAKVKIAQRKEERRQARLKARKEKISYEKALFMIQYPKGEKEHEEESGALDLLNSTMSQQRQNQASGVQLQVVNGVIAVDTDSQVVLRGANLGPDDRMVEIENPFENPVTSRTYTKLAHTDPWTQDDVIRLYNALSTWGTDFTFIAQLFPYRTRRQIKSKFILEEKRNPHLVNLALRRKLPSNFEAFCNKVSKSYEIKSVEDFNREMAEIRRSHEAHLEEINNERERAIKEDLETNRKREIELRAGTKPGSRKDRIRELRKGEVVVGTIDDVKRSRESMENES